MMNMGPKDLCLKGSGSGGLSCGGGGGGRKGDVEREQRWNQLWGRGGGIRVGLAKRNESRWRL